MLKKIAMSLLISLPALEMPLEAAVRAAVDIGSSSIRVTVAEVPTTQYQQRIFRTYHVAQIPLPLKKDLETGGTGNFSPEIQKLTLESLRKIQAEVACYHPQEWVGIATAASRQAKNAPELYQRVEKELGIKMHIIPQDEEGRLGFLTAQSVSGIPTPHIAAFDIGGGSFQLATLLGNNLDIVQGNVGAISAISLLVKEIRGKKYDINTSPNPISQVEAELLVEKVKNHLPELSPAFAKKLAQYETRVVGIGGNKNSTFYHGVVATGKSTYSKEELWQAITAHCDLSDAELSKFASPELALIGMILAYTIMDAYDLENLTCASSNGSCEGLLVTANYWHVKDPIRPYVRIHP